MSDPDQDVPLWVNIVVPIVSMVVFILVLVLLYRTKKEIPVETIEDWVDKIPILNKYLSTEFVEDHDDDKETSKTKHADTHVKAATEKTHFAHSNAGYVDRYDSISTLQRDSPIGGGASSVVSSHRRTNYHYNTGSVISFESNV